MELAALNKTHALSLGRALFTNGLTLAIWQSAQCQFDYPTDRATQRFRKDIKGAPKMILKTQGKIY